MVTYSEWFDPPEPKNDISVRFHRGLVSGLALSDDIQMGPEGKPAAYPTDVPILYTSYDTDAEEVAEQHLLAQGRYTFEDRGDGPQWYLTGLNEVNWTLAVCSRFTPEERTHFVPTDPPPPGASGWELEDPEASAHLTWRAEGEAMWRTSSEEITHRVVAADPELLTFGPPFLKDARLPMAHPIGEPPGVHKLWGQGPTLFQFNHAAHDEQTYYPFTYQFPGVMPLNVMIGPHITDPFATPTEDLVISFNYLLRVRNLRFYVDVTFGSRWRWVFGERGTWNLRQRQALPGTSSWPLRQRQNGGATGSWGLRQRQKGM